MLAYAASRPAIVERQSHPNFLLGIIAAHVAVVALVMSAKMDLPTRVLGTTTDIFNVPIPKDPDPIEKPHNPTTQTTHTTQLTRTDSEVKLPPTAGETPSAGEPDKGQGTVVATLGNGTLPVLPPPHTIVRLGPELVTPPGELRPPYPVSKIMSEEEATLRLRLTIDEHGRVVAVDPVGKADRVFLQAARAHLIKHWRYRPASEDGSAVGSSTVITLTFQLDG
jgi:protein TonB